MMERFLLLSMALLSVSAAPPTEALRQLTKSHLAFQGNPCALQRSPTLQGVRDTASCRMPKTRLHSLSEASTVAHLEENVDRHMDHQLKARTEPEVSIDPLQLLPRHHGMVVKPHNQRASIACIVSHALDGISAIFSLACGSATLACMGILEWSSIASLALIIGSFTTAVGSLMVMPTRIPLCVPPRFSPLPLPFPSPFPLLCPHCLWAVLFQLSFSNLSRFFASSFACSHVHHLLIRVLSLSSCPLLLRPPSRRLLSTPPLLCLFVMCPPWGKIPCDDTPLHHSPLCTVLMTLVRSSGRAAMSG
mmetsp:Transcript_94947/g.138673  ORF Transcript_94947/g.138673 Transcript_94947/m.138673 type:complete len:305 (-) Transcript_94947:630-1544(-)